ncbi:hypothetical protein AVEN_48359-1 [Araneus ventricosus]|uniref:Uncharacterized protein n=1 Tax=Araneus ventricosus TaxID=182803 RepID=A0A4Y2SH27_ARAVE|nr:hypothetical protein AVEN_48359-1 [Araneus ventricosus]
MARILARWQACSGTVQDGGNAGEEFLCVGICEVFFGDEHSACILTLEHNCPRLSQMRTAISLDRARWSGRYSFVAMALQIARSHATRFLPVGLYEGQSLCTPNANNVASTAGTHHCCCDGLWRKYAIECLDGTGLPLGCVPGD